jgi:predicted permease
LNVIGTVLSIFLLLFIGYAAKKVRLLRAEDADVLNTLVIYLTIPPFIFNAVYSYREPLPLSLAKVPVIGFVTILLVLTLAYALGRALRLDRRMLGGMIVACGFGNTGFLGYPVVLAAFGSGGALVTAALYDELAMALPLYTLGVLIIAGFAGERVSRSQLLSVLKLPGIWAIPAALILRPFDLPQPLLTVLRYLGDGTIPLVMISLGLSLSARSLRGVLAPALAVCVLKLAVLPFLTYQGLVLGGVTGVASQVTVVEAAMPSAMMSAVLAAKFGSSGTFVCAVIFVSTLLSIVTIPITLLLLGV